MNVVYIAKARIPSESANSIHVMKICEAFAEIVDRFALIVPQFLDDEEKKEKCFDYYGVSHFHIERVDVNMTNQMKSRYLFPLKAIQCALKQKPDIVVTRDPIVAFLGVCFHKHTVLDLHGELAHLCGRAYRMIKFKWFTENKYLHLVMISKELCEYYHKKYNVPMKCMTVLPDGYTAKNFEEIIHKPILKEAKISIGYCGGFMVGKGIGLIAKMAGLDTENTYHLYGGSREKAEKEVGEVFPSNVIFHGFIPNAKVPETLMKHDVLLLPNQDKLICKGEDIGKVTSPLKMFEYMASGRVIVASDLKVLREVLSDKNSYIVKADDPREWVNAIKYIDRNREEALRKTQEAVREVNQYSWASRARKMLHLAEGTEK